MLYPLNIIPLLLDMLSTLLLCLFLITFETGFLIYKSVVVATHITHTYHLDGHPPLFDRCIKEIASYKKPEFSNTANINVDFNIIYINVNNNNNKKCITILM